jgi:DNA-binding NtrC family response regulator
VWRFVDRQNGRLRAESDARAEGLVMASVAIRRALELVVEAARRDMRLLLFGPSGSGKEGLARCYHRHSGRSGPFVARNCASLRPELLQSDLFGAEPGSFTGCTRRITGAVERAHGGTLFLDEIGEMDETVQAMLLRFLDSGEYERMGAYGQPRFADVRIVSATNKDLRAAVTRGEFREDLWYRLSIEVVEVPPLRERFADIVAFLGSKLSASGISMQAALAPSALEVLRAHRWDGNFRELVNFAKRFPSDADIGSVDAEACRELLQRGAISPARTPVPVAGDKHELPAGEWSRAASQAADAFLVDRGQAPSNWDDVKDYIEKYFKPLIFASLAQLGGAREAVEVQTLANRLEADRGTVQKQVNRYFERFGTGG